MVDKVPSVSIDPSGRFKYILIRLEQGNVTKHVVRGFACHEYHADILDEFENGITSKQIRVDCTGGGRILHEPEKKSILVYGYSQGFGRADHQMTVDLLKQHYTDYESITFSNEGY